MYLHACSDALVNACLNTVARRQLSAKSQQQFLCVASITRTAQLNHVGMRSPVKTLAVKFAYEAMLYTLQHFGQISGSQTARYECRQTSGQQNTAEVRQYAPEGLPVFC